MVTIYLKTRDMGVRMSKRKEIPGWIIYPVIFVVIFGAGFMLGDYTDKLFDKVYISGH